MKHLFTVVFLFSSAAANAQWAVYDHDVHKQLENVNNVNQVANELNEKFKSQLSAGGESQDLTLGTGSGAAVLKGLDTKFETIELSEEDQKKYVGTLQDCGSNEEKFLQHYNACAGLRNLRLQILYQSQKLLTSLDARRQQIVGLVKKSRDEIDVGSRMNIC